MDSWVKWAIGGACICGAGLIGFLNQSKLSKDQFKEFKESNKNEHETLSSAVTNLRESSERNFNRMFDKLENKK